jgi:hypothetical protein
MIELPPLPPFDFENSDNGDVFGCEKTYFYTAKEMRAYGEACARAALEAAAKACDARNKGHDSREDREARWCAVDILQLATAPSSPSSSQTRS